MDIENRLAKLEADNKALKDAFVEAWHASERVAVSRYLKSIGKDVPLHVRSAGVDQVIADLFGSYWKKELTAEAVRAAIDRHLCS